VTINRSVLIAAALVALVMSACQSGAGNGNGSASNATANTTNQTASNANQSAAAKTESSPAQASGSLATPTETYKTAYAARQNKDIAGLKRVLSKDALQFLAEVGKDEKKSLDDQLKELAERPQAPRAETRNEEIEGDTASLEYLNERGSWSRMDFVKEGNDWKIGLPKKSQ
jgi:3-oxoacyl-ACP reductase-like protein